MTNEEWQTYDDWMQACYKIDLEEKAKVFRPGKTGLPFRILEIDPPPAERQPVWVWEDEDWDGGAGIGWHQTTMYGGYAANLAGCNWWDEPVCGRSGGNPFWMPGDTLEADLPDLRENSKWRQIDTEMRRAYKAAASARYPPFAGKQPSFSDILLHSVFAPRIAWEKKEQNDDSARGNDKVRTNEG